MVLEFLKKWGLVSLAILAPIHAVIIATCIIVGVDLILGIWAARKRGEEITSAGLRRTITKILVYNLVLITSFLVETYLIGGLIPLVKLAAGIIGLTEMKSILENANDISGENIFKSIIKKLGSDNDKNN